MKTIKQLLITVAVLLCSATASAHDFEVDGIFYNIISASDLTIEVTYKGDSFDDFSAEYSGEVIIPETVVYKSKVLKVTSIGYSAFKDCHGLTSVVIGNSVTSIEQYAFGGCSNLTSVTIGENVAKIGNAAFFGCTSLEEVHISNLSAWCNINIDTYAPGPYAEKLYLNGELVTDLVIPDDITTIKEYTFAYCKSLTSVKISNSVTSIERSAFEGCSNLTSVTIGENVANIESKAFYGCTSLKYLHIENGTEMLCLSQNVSSTHKVGEGLFFDCPLETLYIGRNLDYNTSSNYGYSPFYNKKTLKSVIIGNNVTSIKTNAFKNCDMITGIYLLGTTPPAVGNNNFTNSQYMNLTIYVPQGTLDAYQNANVWKNFWNIYEEGTTETPDVEVKKCATPVIIYNNSGFDITSETDGAEIHTNITCSDANSYSGGRIDLSATYDITTYATKEGYLNSETATATLCWIAVNGESEETNIIKVEALPVLITSNNGTIKICGGKEGAEVIVYNINGVAIGNATITNGNATISTSLAKGEIVIVNIAGMGIKVAMH